MDGEGEGSKGTSKDDPPDHMEIANENLTHDVLTNLDTSPAQQLANGSVLRENLTNGDLSQTPLVNGSVPRSDLTNGSVFPSSKSNGNVNHYDMTNGSPPEASMANGNDPKNGAEQESTRTTTNSKTDENNVYR